MSHKNTLTKLCLVMTAACTSACPDISSMLRLYGYSELRPPSTLLAPGALVSVIKKKPFTAAVVCGPRASLGPDWVPTRSNTASTEIKKVNGKSFILEAEFLDQIKADARFSSISQLVVTLNNAMIVELQDTDVIRGMAKRSPECRKAVEARLAHGFDITMISSGLIGDVVYSVKWNNSANLDVKAKVQTLSQLAIELGGGATCTTDTEIRAAGLMWGIRDDKYLAYLSIPGVDEHLVTPGSRIVEAQHVAKILPIPDAPVVPQQRRGFAPADEPVGMCPMPGTSSFAPPEEMLPHADSPEGAPIWDPRRPPRHP